MSKVNAWAVFEAGGELKPYEFELPSLQPEWVEIEVEHCGLCHSDLSMIDNEWRRSAYPLVPGHEIIGTVVACGDQVQRLKPGDRVGVGWFVDSCHHCDCCVGGDQHLCAGTQETIIGRHGGFADRVQAHWLWAEKLPEAIEPQLAGPLFCAGATVFSPIVEFDIKPTDKVAVVGLGGLGHLATQFLRAWGCEVTVFSSSEEKAAQAMELGAHRVVNSRDKEALKPLAGQFDFVLVTINVGLNWMPYVKALAPHGRLHFVGAVLDPLAIPAFALAGGQNSISGSPMARPLVVRQMLEFAARHNIRPWVNSFSMNDVNAAVEHLRSGQARYRVVLDSHRAS